MAPEQLGLPQVYNFKDHPLPCLTAMLNGVEHANFFETRVERRVARRGQLELLADS